MLVTEYHKSQAIMKKQKVSRFLCRVDLIGYCTLSTSEGK